MKARSSLVEELRKSMNKRLFQSQITAQTNKFSGMRIGRSTAPGPSNTPDQITWRAKYAACVVDWNALTPEQQAAYQEDADKRKITAFNQFMSDCLLEVPPPPEYEDYTTYEKVDPASDFTVITNKITYDTVRNDELCYVRKDKGVDHFGDFEHLVDVTVTETPHAIAYFNFWALSQVVTSQYGMSIELEGLCAYHLRQTGIGWLFFKDYNNGNGDYYELISPYTTYYLTIKRVGTVGTLKIYSDSERTDLLDTLTIETTTLKYRYIFGAMSFGHPTYNPERQSSGYVEKLKLL